mmetsp:Transcript_18699/g.43606  ORF Transcript_18699/g.43606 Transcript_18699/m.43606 type:complete len:485 (+) Transcript_18699:235-1689(+)
MEEHKNKPKRVHRKSHGVISFRNLARTIADRWKLIDVPSKRILEHFASQEKQKYSREFKAWKARKKEREAARAAQVRSTVGASAAPVSTTPNGGLASDGSNTERDKKRKAAPGAQSNSVETSSVAPSLQQADAIAALGPDLHARIQQLLQGAGPTVPQSPGGNVPVTRLQVLQQMLSQVNGQIHHLGGGETQFSSPPAHPQFHAIQQRAFTQPELYLQGNAVGPQGLSAVPQSGGNSVDGVDPNILALLASLQQSQERRASFSQDHLSLFLLNQQLKEQNDQSVPQGATSPTYPSVTSTESTQGNPLQSLMLLQQQQHEQQQQLLKSQTQAATSQPTNDSGMGLSMEMLVAAMGRRQQEDQMMNQQQQSQTTPSPAAIEQALALLKQSLSSNLNDQHSSANSMPASSQGNPASLTANQLANGTTDASQPFAYPDLARTNNNLVNLKSMLASTFSVGREGTPGAQMDTRKGQQSPTSRADRKEGG